MIKGISENYEKMIEKIETNSLHVRNQENKKLACYFYNQGKQYDGNLMVVGRAGNGCDDKSSWKQGDSKNRSIHKFVEETYNKQKEFGLDWINKWWGRKESDNGEKLYNSATPFWKLVKAVLKGINEEPWDETNWPEKIVWSNIYKLSPMNGGNPNYTLQMLQLDYCKEILKIEIEICKPKNILFITNKLWFNDVKSLFEIDGTRCLYKYKDGTFAHVYVCERPEFKSPAMIAEIIVNEIKSQI